MLLSKMPETHTTKRVIPASHRTPLARSLRMALRSSFLLGRTLSLSSALWFHVSWSAAFPSASACTDASCQDGQAHMVLRQQGRCALRLNGCMCVWLMHIHLLLMLALLC